jgi:hypothetical protein
MSYGENWIELKYKNKISSLMFDEDEDEYYAR